MQGVSAISSSYPLFLIIRQADVGGFFGNPEPEMLVRWYHVGAFSPFFRAHAHIDTKRREPYLLDEPYKSHVRNILRLRYSMLPVWYTAFRENSETGLPVVRFVLIFLSHALNLKIYFTRPHYVVFPKDPNGFSIDDQYFIGGSGLLVKPVTRAGVTEETVYLPEDQVNSLLVNKTTFLNFLVVKVYYDYFSHQAYRGSPKGNNVTIPAALHQVPLLLRGGSIIPTRERPRRSSPLMKHDPFTLRVALDKDSTARGEVYLDDGVTYDHEGGKLVWRQFVAQKLDSKGGIRISSKDLATAKLKTTQLAVYDPKNKYARSLEDVRVEKIIVLGLATKPSKVSVEGDFDLVWEYEEGVASSDRKQATASVLTIKDPRVSIAHDWTIVVAA